MQASILDLVKFEMFITQMERYVVSSRIYKLWSSEESWAEG